MPGQPGGSATFKWSRDNASIGSRVASVISASELELESLGRDEVLRFNTGDFVEILDDVREFAQLGGEMRSITVANATRRITLSAPLPADMLPAAFPDSTFPAAQPARASLEPARRGAGDRQQRRDHGVPGSVRAGIQRPHQGAGRGYHAAARERRDGELRLHRHRRAFAPATTGCSPRAPPMRPWRFSTRRAPRGIHHHYARLGFWDAGTNTEPTDCRHHWPPTGGGDDCACTQCVTPESHASGQLTIEEAVNRVRETGGTVCLKAGQYALRAAVPVGNARSVRIRGEGIDTMLLAPAGAFAIDTGIAVAIENLAMTTTGKLPAISVRSGFGISLHDLFIVVANPDAPAAAVALSGVVFDLAICNNWISAPFGIRALDSTAPEAFHFLTTSSLRIENNVFLCERQAITFAGHRLAPAGHEHPWQRDFELPRSRHRHAGLGAAGLGGTHHRQHAQRQRPRHQLRHELQLDRGQPRDRGRSGQSPAHRAPGSRSTSASIPRGSDQCQLLANQVSGFPDAGILINAPVQDLICKLNIIENCGNGILTAAGGCPGLGLDREQSPARHRRAARAAAG